MAKYPKFLECVNPNGDPGDLYILHTRHPRFLAQLLISNDEKEIMEFQRHFNIGGRTDYKGMSALVGVIDFWDNPYKEENTPQKQADNIARLMRRCADWYHGTLKDMVENENN